MLLLQRKLDSTWDYRGESTKIYTHGFHSYPAMFIPQIAKRLLETYSKHGDTVLDIFCGSGTVLVESMLLKRNSIGIDLNPLAIFIAKVKTTPLNPKVLQRSYFDLIFRIANIKLSELSKPNFFNIDFWFKEDVIFELARIKAAIDEIPNENVRNFFLIAFSETARYVSNMKHGEFKLVRIKNDKLTDYSPRVLETFRRYAEKNISGMVDFFQTTGEEAPMPRIILGDSSKEISIQADSVDCIITSPPYGDSRTTVAYGQFSRLSLQWLDLADNTSVTKIDNSLLGGKIVVSEKNIQSNSLKKALSEIEKMDKRRAEEVYSFYSDISPCLQNAHRLLKKGKHFCIVIGNRTVKGVRLPSDFILSEMCVPLGFKVEDILVRAIPNKRMPSKNSPTNKSGFLEETMTKESIVILKKLN